MRKIDFLRRERELVYMETKNLSGAVKSADVASEKLEALGVAANEPGGHLQIQKNLDGVLHYGIITQMLRVVVMVHH
jgi:hypothetical protein